MKHFSHLNTAIQLIQHYRGEMPFSIYLKSFFSKHKKHGSKDRKRIGHLCYSFFRLGKSLQTHSIEEKILIGSFLCGRQNDDLLQQLKPNWNANINSTIDEKISLLLQENISFSPAGIFPWKDALSYGIDHEQFSRSFLTQPDLFLRIRPGHEKTVRQKLGDAGMMFSEISHFTIALPNASKIDSVLL
ncbi:MAG TPA: Fmu (Sun) domain-containing protein, partial [Chitinophagaceae bacterium]